MKTLNKMKNEKGEMRNCFFGSAILVLSAFCFLLSSCSQDEVFEQDSLKDTPITILSAGVADLSTRAGTPAGTLTSGSLSFFFNNNSGDNARYVADCEKWT